MTYREAANRIEEHIQIHYKNEYPHAVLITEALQMAVTLLRERADLENCSKAVRKGDAIWYVDFESGEIEEGEVFSIQFKDGRIDSFSVDFKETGNFDEFVGDAIGDCFFISKEMAESALANGQGDIIVDFAIFIVRVWNEVCKRNGVAVLIEVHGFIQ